MEWTRCWINICNLQIHLNKNNKGTGFGSIRVPKRSRFAENNFRTFVNFDFMDLVLPHECYKYNEFCHLLKSPSQCHIAGIRLTKSGMCVLFNAVTRLFTYFSSRINCERHFTLCSKLINYWPHRGILRQVAARCDSFSRSNVVSGLYETQYVPAVNRDYSVVHTKLWAIAINCTCKNDQIWNVAIN